MNLSSTLIPTVTDPAATIPPQSLPAQSVLAQATPKVPTQMVPPMNSADPLAELRDLHLPEAVSTWPPAPGWWLMTIISLSLLVWAVIKWRRHISRNRYRKLAQNELEQLYVDFSTYDDSSILLQQISQLLRRVALISFPRHKIASLQGEAWLQFLADSSELQGFVNGEGQVLANGPYEQAADFNPLILRNLVSDWLRIHKVRTWEKVVVSRSDPRSESCTAPVSGQEVARADS